MKNFIQKKLVFLIILFLLFATACSSTVKETSEISQTPSSQMLIKITYCNVDASDLCLEGFGQEGEDKLLILFKAENPSFTDIYIQEKENSVLFTCSQSQDFSENIYCVGDTFSNGEDIQLEIYTKKDKKLVATGEFKVQYGIIEMPDNINFEDVDSSEYFDDPDATPSYPNPSYPNPPYSTPSYPNPSYSNPSYLNPTPSP